MMPSAEEPYFIPALGEDGDDDDEDDELPIVDKITPATILPKLAISWIVKVSNPHDTAKNADERGSAALIVSTNDAADALNPRLVATNPIVNAIPPFNNSRCCELARGNIVVVSEN